MQSDHILGPLWGVRIVAGQTAEILRLLVAGTLSKLLEVAHNRHLFAAGIRAIIDPIFRQ